MFETHAIIVKHKEISIQIGIAKNNAKGNNCSQDKDIIDDSNQLFVRFPNLSLRCSDNSLISCIDKDEVVKRKEAWNKDYHKTESRANSSTLVINHRGNKN